MFAQSSLEAGNGVRLGNDSAGLQAFLAKPSWSRRNQQTPDENALSRAGRRAERFSRAQPRGAEMRVMSVTQGASPVW
jgi:hypothetical protein